MPTTMKKLSINTDALHSARRKLQSKQPDDCIEVTQAERKALLHIIRESKDQLYPGSMAVDRYQYHLDQIGKVEPHTRQFQKFAAKIEEFEEKYCK